ncbi:MAG: glycosyltransferase family 4 protein, partial [Chloroflexota bacterium]
MTKVVMLGNFSLHNKGTMRARALPLARALVKRGHDVSLVLSALDAPKVAGTLTTEDGVAVYHLPARKLPLVREGGVVADQVHHVWTARPDVVHVFKPISFAGAAGAVVGALRAARLRGCRLVVDSDDWEGTGGWVDLDRRPSWQRWIVDRQERWGLHHGDAVTVASRHLMTLSWALGVPPSKVFYVPNGIDNTMDLDGEAAGRVRSALDLGDAPVILLYTRFFEFDLHSVVSLLRQTVSSLPQAKLLVVGRGFYGEENRLETMLAEEGLASSARFAGWVEPKDLPTYFAAADVAVYPFADTLVNRTKCPAKLVELLAAGVPVVAQAVGQIQEYVEHGVSGLLVSAGEDEAFAHAAVDLLGDAALRERLGAGALRRISEQFLWERLVPRVEAAYGIESSDGVA